MNAMVCYALTVLVSAGGTPAPQNALLTELVEKGVQMPDGQLVRLPPPTMAEGLNAAEQAAVLAKVAPGGKVEEFMSRLSNAAYRLKLGTTPSKRPPAQGKGPDLIRTVNLHFVVYGDWNVLISDEFSKSILKEGKPNNGDSGMVKKAGYLKATELAVRPGLSARSAPNMKEYFFYTTLELFDRVEVSDTRFGVATKTPMGVIVAAKLDPRFEKDREYPNEWHSINRNAAPQIAMGPAQPYSGAGFYAKVTRLINPKDAIFVEFHQVFYEPEAWFGEDDRLMTAKLGQAIPFKVRAFRGKLGKATEDAKKNPPAAAK
jgi:hypothetical protein